MNWWKRFWSNPYRWGLWQWIGKRPWTFIIRDVYHKAEFLWIVGLVSLGMWLGHIFGIETILKGWLIFSIGYLSGHLFWNGYIPHQKANRIKRKRTRIEN